MRLVGAPPDTARAFPAWMLDPSARRPGELLEPFHLPAQAGERLSAAAARAGISADIAATVLVERSLVAADLKRLNLTAPTPRLEELRPTRRLTAAEGDYLRLLTLGKARGRSVVPEPASATVPVRLISRAPEVLGAAIESATLVTDLHEALSWEVAALLAGRTLGEWTLAAAVERLS